METNREITPARRFWLLLQPDRKEIINIYIYAVFSGLVTLSLPLGIQAIINLIQGGQINTSWILLVIFVISGIGVTGILQIFQLRITENLQQRLFTRVAFEFAYRLPRIKSEVLYKHHAPELMNRFFDTVSAQKGLAKILIDFSTAGLNVLFGLLLLSFYHTFFIVYSLVLVGLAFIIVRLTINRGLATSMKESKYKYQVAYWLEELARVNTSFKLVGKTPLPLQRTDAHVGDYLKAREAHFRVLIQHFSLMIVFKVLIAAGLLVMGGILVMEQEMNIGQFVAAEIIILTVMASVEKLIVSLETIYDVLTSLEKIGQVTDMELERSKGIILGDACPSPNVSLDVERLSFSYPGSDHLVLDDISFHLDAGERLFITGPTGSGKSTLLTVLAALYEVKQGSVSYNGLPSGNLKTNALRAEIGECFVQGQLFNETVLTNITMGREKATFERVQWSVANLGLSDFIRQLPNGYDTVINPEGRELPRSVVQKILLARCIVTQPKLLLLEYAFESLNLEERSAIIDFITGDDKKWTIIAASSENYLAERLGKVAIMAEGKITKIGSYHELKNDLNLKYL